MLSGFIIKKGSMEKYFLDNGTQITVTHCQANPLTVTQVKTDEKDGYQSVQVAYGSRKRLDKPTLGKMKKLALDLTPKGFLEFKATADASTSAPITVGSQVTIDTVVSEGDRVDVTGTSKGHGYSGVIKRYGFHRQPVSGGQSDRTRAPGAIGAQTPGKVVRGKKMPGHYGNVTHTVTNLRIVKINKDASEILISGSIPGSRNAWVIIKKSYHEN